MHGYLKSRKRIVLLSVTALIAACWIANSYSTYQRERSIEKMVLALQKRIPPGSGKIEIQRLAPNWIPTFVQNAFPRAYIRVRIIED